MYDCIFAPYCTKTYCDRSCPTYAETGYLLERNNINMQNPVLKASEAGITKALEVIDTCDSKVGVWVSNNNPEGTADLITYCAICKYFKGSRLHCTVYHLNFARYIELIKDSWSRNSKSEELSYMDIWCQTSTVLIVSGFRYMKFNDFECQTMLTLLDNRMVKMKTTIVVTSDVESLVGASNDFLPKLKQVLRERVITC